MSSRRSIISPMHGPAIFIVICWMTLLQISPSKSYGNWVHQADTTIADYPTEGISFGFCWNGVFLCYPIYLPGAEKYERKLSKYVETMLAPYTNGPVDEHYFEVPRDTISNMVKDNIGDTVMIMWSAGRFRGIIKGYAFYEGYCSGFLYCALEMLDTVPKPPPDWITYMALRRNRFYSGSLIPYKKYQLPDTLYNILNDSLRELMYNALYARDDSEFARAYENITDDFQKAIIEQNWQKWKAGEHYHFDRHITIVYGEKRNILPDNFFLFSKSDSFGTWYALYYYKMHDPFNLSTLQPPHESDDISGELSIDCAFDLNGDGTLEYFVDRGGWAAIFTIIDGRFLNLRGCEYRGCG